VRELDALVARLADKQTQRNASTQLLIVDFYRATHTQKCTTSTNRRLIWRQLVADEVMKTLQKIASQAA